MDRNILAWTALALLAFTSWSARSNALVPLPQAWWTFDNDDWAFQQNGSFDGIIKDQGPNGLNLFVQQYNGLGGQPQRVFEANSYTDSRVSTVGIPPEHYVISGASFPNATVSSPGNAYHMQGGYHTLYSGGDTLDPQNDTPVASLVDKFSARDVLRLAPEDRFGRGLLDSDANGGPNGGILTYSFWSMVVDNQVAKAGLTSRGPFSHLIGRRSHPDLDDGGFGGQVAVTNVAGSTYGWQVRNDPGGELATNSLFQVGNWHHFVIEYNMTGEEGEGTVDIWKDGVLTDTFTGFGNKRIAGPMFLNQVAFTNAEGGNDDGTLSESGNFYIDDLGIWVGTELSPQDIQDIYTKGITEAVGGHVFSRVAEETNEGNWGEDFNWLPWFSKPGPDNSAVINDRDAIVHVTDSQTVAITGLSDGLLDITPTGILNSPQVTLTGGTVTGSGIINGNVLNTGVLGAVLSPGDYIAPPENLAASHSVPEPGSLLLLILAGSLGYATRLRNR